MKKIGIISDTHAFWDEKFAKYFAECDEIWHAGDIGSMYVAERLNEICPLRAVHGNIDGGDVRITYPEILRWKCEDVDVLMKHIGGYPGKYDASIAHKIYSNPPQLFISGHSHILKVKYDKNLNLLHINPGAAGLSGWQQQRTIIRLTIDGSSFKDLEIIELNK
ncbi:MAG: metallophosphoesterase family protein [Prevotellaceae bacterium]|nr:metallophosphoesterase family protein [Prevotellaceae bacterium]